MLTKEQHSTPSTSLTKSIQYLPGSPTKLSHPSLLTCQPSFGGGSFLTSMRLRGPQCPQPTPTFASVAAALIAPPPQDRTALQWFQENYPLHPDTLRVIMDRIASNDNFQNTRGILRLLGMTAHYLKKLGTGR